MLPVLEADAVRRIEAAHRASHPGLDLMDLAATALSRHVLDMIASGRGGDGGDRAILLVAGPGDNAGDALLAAALLPNPLASAVRILAVRGRTHERGLAACLAAGGTVVDEEESLRILPDAALVIDAVAGLGSKPLEGTAARIAQEARTRRAPVLSVDLPSGLRADRADAPEATFYAQRTVCMVALKLCLVQQPAASRAGTVHLEDLGVSSEDARTHQLREDDLAPLVRVPGPMDHKYTRGVVGLETGSRTYPGAAVLGVAGALSTGTGMVRYVGGASQAVTSRFPSVVPLEGRVQAWVCGSGWDVSDETARSDRRHRLADLLAQGLPMVLDAGALDVLPTALPPSCLLTPHAGELSRLIGRDRRSIESQPIDAAREAAEALGAVVLLKGATQVVASPEGTALIAVRGPAWTAQAGSGDVLAGSCGALLAAGLPALEAAALAASLQAVTARENPGPVTPDRLAELFPATISRWTRGRDPVGEIA